MITRTRFAAGREKLRLFPAEEAAEPMVTLPTSSRALSNPRSKLTATTCAPSCESRLTGTVMSAAPGRAEPLPTEKTATPDP
jgi:hypothetical protein